MKYYTTTAKMGDYKREYRRSKSDGIQCKDQSGGWFQSHHSVNSFEKYIRWGFIEEVK